MKDKLFTKDFTLLWLGKAVSQLGDGAGFIGLMWWVNQAGSATALGLMAAVSSLVRVALSPFSGALADRVSKKHIIVLMDVLRGLVYLSMGYMAWAGHLTLLRVIILSATNTVFSVFFGPAISSSLPLLVSPGNLPRANSFMQMTGIVVQIVSYSAGGVLVAFIGVPLLMLINGASFLLSAFSEAFMTIPAVAAAASQQSAHFLANIKEGFAYVKGHRVLFDIMKTAAVINFIGAPLFILLPKFVNEHLQASVEVYGYLLACMTGGALVASLLIAFTKVVQRNVWVVMHGITIQGTLYVLFTLLPRNAYAPFFVVFFLAGIVNGIVNIYFGSLLQRMIAKEHMGKVFGLLDSMSGALQPLSQGMTGVLGDQVAVATVYLGAGALGVATGAKFSLIPNLRSWLKPEDSMPIPSPAAAAD